MLESIVDSSPLLHIIKKRTKISMAKSTGAKESQEQEENKKHVARVVEAKCDQNVLEFVLDAIDKYKIKSPSSKFCKKLKSSLDSNFKKEWNVLVGGHFSGICCFIENTYMEFMLDDGNLRVVVFQSYSPENFR